MQVTLTNYHRLARSVGLLLTLMGASMTALFAVYTWTGENPLAHANPSIDSVGLLILASIGAFALPLGLSLFSADASTSARVKIAAYALGIMAVLRLAAFANPEMRAVVGVTPLYEFVVLGALGLIAFLVRPETEANIDVRMTIDVARSAREAWTVLGEQFGDVGLWATAVASSSLEGDVGVGAVRTCQIPGFGPVAAGIITEELTHYDAESMKFTYVPKEGVPRMIKRAQNQWSIGATGPNQCQVTSHASIELRWWALPFSAWIGWGIRSSLSNFEEELAHRIEEGVAHPRKEAALARP